ncbi:hypothetical protein NIES4074_64620 (plasmid) [Cylindrospermum sp. NIES-4074]|nr:hypothetical protein NIES4074_64620 [Cylindrospermum sp. NIES-4074]
MPVLKSDDPASLTETLVNSLTAEVTDPTFRCEILLQTFRKIQNLNWYYPLRSSAILVAVPIALLKISIKPLTLAEMPL